MTETATRRARRLDELRERGSGSSLSIALEERVFVLVEEAGERGQRFVSCCEPSRARRNRRLVTLDEPRREPDDGELVRDSILVDQVLHVLMFAIDEGPAGRETVLSRIVQRSRHDVVCASRQRAISPPPFTASGHSI